MAQHLYFTPSVIFFSDTCINSEKNGSEWFRVTYLLTHIYTKCLLKKAHRVRILCHLRATSR
jgi:hypothetical protein